MKYIEQIKSIALFVLVLLSIALTFTNWTFRPEYGYIEETPAVETSSADKRSAEEVVKPLKVLFHFDDLVTGTVESEQTEPLLSTIEQWDVENLRVLEENVSNAEIISYLHSENRVVLQYPAAVPFPVFDAFMKFSNEASVPEASFDRLVINYRGAENNQPSLYFVDTIAKRVYAASVNQDLIVSFRERFVTEAFSYPSYTTREEFGVLPVYVPEETVKKPTYSYVTDEVRDRFTEALLSDPTVAQGGLNMGNNQFRDGSAIVRFDTNMRTFSFVQTDAETGDPAVPSELLFNTLDFLNEHGGWTDEYRYFAINPVRQYINYQLFVDDLPVFSSSLATDIKQWWGNEEVYMYLRPYYTLYNVVPDESDTTDLVSGTEVLAALNRVEGLDTSTIKDIIPGYLPEMHEDGVLITFTPTWFYLIDSTWTPVTEEVLGGGRIGLE